MSVSDFKLPRPIEALLIVLASEYFNVLGGEASFFSASQSASISYLRLVVFIAA